MRPYLLRAATPVVALFALAAAPAGARAQGATSSADSATIVAVADRFVAALEARDTAYIRAASLPSMRQVMLPVPTPDSAQARVQTLDQVIHGLATRERPWRGRLLTPLVTVTGPIAILSAPYEARTEGSAPYCGMDHYIFARAGGRWLVSELIYTRQLTDCPPAPVRHGR